MPTRTKGDVELKLNNTTKALLTTIAVLMLGTAYLFFQRGSAENESLSYSETVAEKESATQSPKSGDNVSASVYIHVLGQVKKPGVYRFDKEPRGIEVVEKAGGFTKNADTASVNLALSVSDGTQFVIEDKRNAKKKAGASKKEEDDKRVNLNTASQEELQTIPGIGPSKAVQIISYRETNGSFKTIEDIMKISGIKEGVFNKIKDSIKV